MMVEVPVSRVFRHRRKAVLVLAPALALGTVLFRPTVDRAEPLAALTDSAALDALALPADPAPLYAQAAEAVRARDLAAVRRVLAPLTGPQSPVAGTARVLMGLYAHALEEVAVAEEWLASAAGAGGDLEDWRLYVLADSAAARGHREAAQEALDQLLADHPGSPLRARALLRAAELAWEEGDATRALALVARGRDGGLASEASEAATQLETLAWEIGGELGVPEIQRAAARRLLVEAPLEASRLQVIEIFRPVTGSLDWLEVLSPVEIMARARRLGDIGLHPNAWTTLEVVPPPLRDLEWRLLGAAALTASHRGEEALRLLEGEAPAAPAEQAAVALARGLAAADLAIARSSGPRLSSAARQGYRQLSHEYFREVARLAADQEKAITALRLLYADLTEDQRFEDSVAVLRAIRDLDPADKTGAQSLWQSGWREFSGRNHSGAIGYWSELLALYPDGSLARSGRYWTARAHEALGNEARAREVYLEIVAADITDFYRKHAAARLRTPLATDAAAVPAQATEPWPADPLLARARRLTELGLDDLAWSEMEALAEAAEPRALAGLEGVVLARKGDRRESIRRLARAFPALGGHFQAIVPEDALRLYYPIDFRDIVERHARLQGLPAPLVFGVIRQESAFDAGATSRSGARGLMQVMPATGKELAGKLGLPYAPSRLYDPDYSIRLGTTYLRQVMEMFEGREELALAGYNGGPYRIKRLWREAGPDPELDRFLEGLALEESKGYVKRILVFSDSYRRLYPGIS